MNDVLHVTDGTKTEELNKFKKPSVSLVNNALQLTTRNNELSKFEKLNKVRKRRTRVDRFHKQ